MEPIVVDYFRGMFNANPDDEQISKNAYSEVNIGNKTFRAHPDYHSEGSWYDWGWVKFSRPPDLGWTEHVGENDKDAFGPSFPNDVVPAKILCFAEGIDGKPKAIVHACEFRESNIGDSVITEEWFLEYDNKKAAVRNKKSGRVVTSHPRKAVVRCIDAESIVGRALVIEEFPGIHSSILTTSHNATTCSKTDRVLIVVDRSLWGQRFT